VVPIVAIASRKPVAQASATSFMDNPLDLPQQQQTGVLY
jgi:hypothetical protein